MKLTVICALVFAIAAVQSKPKINKIHKVEENPDYCYECEDVSSDINFCCYCDEDDVYPDPHYYEDYSCEYDSYECSIEDLYDSCEDENKEPPSDPEENGGEDPENPDDEEKIDASKDYEFIDEPYYPEEEQGICRPNQTFVQRYADCFYRACCDNGGHVDTTRCFVVERPTCVCKRGYVWNRKGECVKLEDCPKDRSQK